MTSVFIVTPDDYEVSIIGVFATRELAEEFVGNGGDLVEERKLVTSKPKRVRLFGSRWFSAYPADAGRIFSDTVWDFDEDAIKVGRRPAVVTRSEIVHRDGVDHYVVEVKGRSADAVEGVCLGARAKWEKTGEAT